MYLYFKRFFDCIAAVCLFIVISPLFAVLAILVRTQLGSPILFKQERSGKGGRTFHIMKFRTMTNATDEEGILLPDEQRFTALGRWLRSTSLDEIPELFNIIRGDMAVIGPRPLPPLYNDYFSEYETSRFKVRGGLIPPESMYFDSFITWNQQLKYEADYANNVSLTLDVKILVSVFKTIFKRTETDYGNYVRDALNVERANSKTQIV
ncbi:MAG: sugar transferase [Bacteroidaceae bacterium]|nr:sugar transferase [Bacteroidaceae bacterium]